MDNNRKKELQAQYAEREIIGGVYLVRNTLNNKLLLCAAADLQGSKNRFEFSRKTGTCVYLKLQKDWEEQGGEQFVYEVLEELKKSETQTQAEFKDDIELLRALWNEKLSNENLY